MSKYLRKFETEAEYSAATLYYPSVAWVTDTDTVHFDKSAPTPPTPTQYRWTQSGTTCIGYDKYQNNIKEQSTDGGETWTVVIPEEYSASTLIEADSQDCGYVPPTPPVFEGKYKLTLNDGSTVSAECDATSAITSEEVSSQYSGTVVSAEIGNCVTSIGGAAFRNCSSLTSITIPDSVTSIGEDAFNGCSGLTSVTIPSGVTSISDYAFASCSRLTSIDIPSGVTSIGRGAFSYCSDLTSITIPSGVTSISGYAFRNCTSLTSVTSNATTPPTLLDANAFKSTNGCPIYVPAASVDTYKAATNWSTYASRIQAIS